MTPSPIHRDQPVAEAGLAPAPRSRHFARRPPAEGERLGQATSPAAEVERDGPQRRMGLDCEPVVPDAHPVDRGVVARERRLGGGDRLGVEVDEPQPWSALGVAEEGQASAGERVSGPGHVRHSCPDVAPDGGTKGAADRRSGQAGLRHTGPAAESCCLPALTRFTGFRCAGPSRCVDRRPGTSPVTIPLFPHGGVRERPIRHAWRACRGQPLVGSNPTPSATRKTIRASPARPDLSSSPNVGS